VVLRHPSRHPREDLVPVGEYHGVEAVPAHPGNSALGLDEVSSRHLAILLIAMAAASCSLPRERALVSRRPWAHYRTCARPASSRGSRCPPSQRARRGVGISAELPLAIRRATATFLDPQQAHRRPSGRSPALVRQARRRPSIFPRAPGRLPAVSRILPARRRMPW